MKKIALTLLTASLSLHISAGTPATTENVTIDNFPRAESDTMLRQSMATTKALFGTQLGELGHLRAPFPLDKQPVIRMNRDTLYSSGVFDLSEPVTVTLGDIDGRYQSLHVINQDHYMIAESKPGTYTLTQEEIGTRYVMIAIRTLVNSDDINDIKLANKAQDKIKVSGGVVGGDLEAPNWNQEQLTELRQLLNKISMFGVDAAKGLGKKEDLDPVHYLISCGSGWGGLPKKEAMYELSNVDNNDGTPHKVTFKDVPVDAFWSVTVYNQQGYIQENDLGVYSFNNLTSKTNPDGSSTIHFGGCEDNRFNCLPIPEGWNYAFRFYQPQEALLSGEWAYPAVTPTK
jgi:hypothetical protein